MEKILLVEDSADIVEMINLFLRNEGFEVMDVGDGEQVMNAVQSFLPDLVIMDIMLPNLDGFSCTAAIREVCNVPIIILTARSAQKDVINGFQIGADDYLCKPFDITELLLRIRSLLNRTKGQVVFDSWTLDERSLSVTVHGNTMQLSMVEFHLLSQLFWSPDKIFSRDQIIDLVYKDYRIVTDRTVDSHIKNLRKKLKQINVDPAHVQSVYGVGYRFQRDLTES